MSARLSADATHVKTIVGDTLALIVRNLATIVASLVIAFSANWILALVILAVVPLLGLEGFVRVKFIKGFSADAKVNKPYISFYSLLSKTFNIDTTLEFALPFNIVGGVAVPGNV